MVTPAGKEMLKNTMNTVKLHNRLLEEHVMWRHWNMEKGLTMMVTDEAYRREKSLSAALKKKKKKEKHREKHKSDKHRSRKSSRSSKNDHIKVSNSSSERWDHSGFEELYPESKSSVKTDSPELKRPFKEDAKKHKPSGSNTSASTHSDSSDSKEVWEEFRLLKKRKSEESSDKVPKSEKYDDGDFDQRVRKKHKKDETTYRKREHCKKCGSRHCHHTHKRKSKSYRHS